MTASHGVNHHGHVVSNTWSEKDQMVNLVFVDGKLSVPLGLFKFIDLSVDNDPERELFVEKYCLADVKALLTSESFIASPDDLLDVACHLQLQIMPEVTNDNLYRVFTRERLMDEQSFAMLCQVYKRRFVIGAGMLSALISAWEDDSVRERSMTILLGSSTLEFDYGTDFIKFLNVFERNIETSRRILNSIGERYCGQIVIPSDHQLIVMPSLFEGRNHLSVKVSSIASLTAGGKYEYQRVEIGNVPLHDAIVATHMLSPGGHLEVTSVKGKGWPQRSVWTPRTDITIRIKREGDKLYPGWMRIDGDYVVYPC